MIENRDENEGKRKELKIKKSEKLKNYSTTHQSPERA
jgi:hypothetical protein